VALIALARSGFALCLLVLSTAGCRNYDGLDGLDLGDHDSTDLAGVDLFGADLAGRDLAGSDNIPDLMCSSSALSYDGGYDAASATTESIGDETRLTLQGDADTGKATLPVGTVLAGDITGDGLVDLIALAPSNSMGADELSISIGATLGAHTQFTPTAIIRQVGLGTTMAIGDLDGDKISEIVLATDGLFEPMSAVAFYDFNATKGRLTPAGELPVPARPRAMAIGDLDLDGSPDLVVGFNQFDGVSAGARPRGLLRVYWGSQGGLPNANIYSEVGDLPSDVTYLVVAQLEGGCLPSLVVGHRSGPSGDNFAVVRHEGLRGLVRDKNTDTVVDNDIQGIAVADLDRDGLDDLVIDSYDPSAGTATLNAFYSRGHKMPRFEKVEISSFTAAPGAISDLDDDGLPDVFFFDQLGVAKVALSSPQRMFTVSAISAVDQTIPATQPAVVRSGAIVDFYYPDPFTADVLYRLGGP
jgi:hypothetical protein